MLWETVKEKMKKLFWYLFFLLHFLFSLYAEKDINFNYVLTGYSKTLDNIVLASQKKTNEVNNVYKTNPSFKISYNKREVIVHGIKIDTFETLLTIFRELEIIPTNVEVLYLRFCELTDLEGIELFTNLRYLDIGFNLLTTFPDFAKNTKLTTVIYNNNKFSSTEEKKIQNYLDSLNLDEIEIYNFKSKVDYEHFIKTNYNEAETLYNSQKYQDAIKKYEEVANAFEYENNEIKSFSSNEDIVDKFKQYEMLYYSLYNIACCYSLINNFEMVPQFLYSAIKAGYPHIDYMVHDKDLQPYFKNDSNAIKMVKDVYKLGNSSQIVEGKKLEYGIGPSTSYDYVFSADSKEVIRKRNAEPYFIDYYCYGEYYVKNYFIICNFKKNTSLEYKSDYLGRKIPESDYEYTEEEINYTEIFPFYLIENVKTYYDWPFLEYRFN